MRRLIWLLLVPVFMAASDRPTEEEDVRTLTAGRVAADGPGLLRYFRQRTVTAAERAEIVALIRKLGDDSYAVRERTGEEIVARGLPAAVLLREAINKDPDVEIVRRAERCLKAIESVPGSTLSAAAVRMLARRVPDGTTEVLIAFLPTADDAAVVEEIRDALAAVAVRNGTPDATLVKGLESKHGPTRAICGESLTRAGHAGARRLMNDPDIDVRLKVTLAAVQHAKDRSAVPALITLLAEVPNASAWKVEEALIRIAGETTPQVSLGQDDASRKKCRDTWMEWWKKNEATIDLAKSDAETRWKNLTLIVHSDIRTLTGRIYEINSNKLVQWSFDDVKLPQDAAVIGTDQVLVAEYLTRSGIGGQVSLRDFRGKVLWQKAVDMPMALQPLPNGHFIVSCRTHFIEFDEKQNEVFKLPPRPEADIIATTKDRNGDYVYFTTKGWTRLAQGKDATSIAITPMGPPNLVGAMELLPNGRLLITQQAGVSEFEQDGKKVWGPIQPRMPTSVQRLPNGNTMIACANERKVMEVDRDGNVTWDYMATDFPPKRARRR